MSIALRIDGELTALGALRRLRREAPGPVAVATAAVALVGGGVVAAFNARADGETYELVAMLGLGLAIATCAALGALVLAARPRHRLGLALLTGGALASAWMLGTSTSSASTNADVVQWASWLENWTFIGLIILVTWPLLLFPDGRLPSRRWRPIAALLALAIIGVGLAGAFDPGTLDEADAKVANPLGIPAGWTWVQAFGAFGVGIPLGVVAGMFAVQTRARRNPEQAMRTALWASRGLAANFVLCLALNLSDSPLADGAFYAATLTTSVSVFAAAAALAVLRDRTIEVDLVLRRAFIVLGVGIGGLLAFVLVFAVMTTQAGDSGSALGGGLAVAVCAVPLHGRVRGGVDRLLYGHRDPVTAVRRVGEQLELAAEPGDALPGVADALRETLGASAVLIEPEDVVGLPAARSGDELYEPVIVRPVLQRGMRLGELVIGARAPGEPYAPGDIALADVLVRQLALVLDTLRMAGEVQQSRESIVNAREEERRRLRRDLHDGLGSALAGIALTLQAARNAGGAHGDELVDGAREQTQAAVADIRRIVRGLRPPVLEDLGIAAALRAHADRLQPLEVELVVPDDLPPLPAAVELALYRIATEALTNVVRHAHADHCRVELRTGDGEAILDIADDGDGLAADATAGVGLRSMNERAAELGGRVELSESGGGGLSVRVRLPLVTAAPGHVISILLIDDNAVFRQGMRDLFLSIDELDVVGVAGDGASGVEAALELQPDVVLMDLAMPGLSGIDATRRLATAAPHIGIVVMTMLEDDDAVVQALRAGARGYLVKGAGQTEILDTIRGVHAGRAVIGATVARQLSALVGAAPEDPFPDLTARERDVLTALAAGASTGQIARRLGLSDKTVRNHVSSILTKLEVPDRVQAVLKARAAGLSA